MSKGNGHIGLLDISQHSYRLIAFGGNQSVSDIYIDKLNYTDVKSKIINSNIGSNFNQRFRRPTEHEQCVW